MPSKAFNFGRGLGRHMCLPITTVIGFSLILMYIFILYQPSKGPGIKQRMGWQSWDVVNLSNKPATSSSSSGGATAGSDLEHAGGSGVDWWNVTTPDDKVDFASLPLDVWSPLLPHDTGLSEIAVTRCMMQPELAGDLCAPKSTSEDDAIKGKWVRVPRDLNLEAGVISGWLNIYYRRTRRQDIRLITELKILGKDERPSPDVDWFATKTSLRAGIVGLKPMFLWYKLGKAVRDMTTEDRANLITELDVLYGEDMPWYGFDILQPATIEQKGKVEATHICYRRGVKIAPKAPPLHFNHDGHFKILQVADLHFSVSQGTCRDTLLSPCTHSDNLTQTLVGHMIDAEKPDLVVFTGDQLNGQGTSWDPRSVLAKFSRAVAEKGIPWAAVFGNHDEEDGLEKEKQVDLMRALPYSLVQRGPKDIHGVGNYVLKVYSPDASKTHILTLYFLDSGSYSKGFLDWFGFFNPTEYDYIRQSQTDWFLQESASIQQIERPFRPDDAKDMGDAWRRQEQITPITRKLAKPNALMFFHMPLTETYNKADMNPRTGKALDVGKTGLEPPGNAKGNDQFFEKGILRAMESDHVANGQAREVKVIANGHCHITENCRRVSGIWFCFGGGGSYSGYSKIGFDRRFRVYDVSEYGETIKTYKRTEHDEVIDKLVLAGTGSAPLS